ncbi:Ankyrin-repeat domain containing transcription coregulator asaA [Colletotrichum tropicale]|nr:Ankyrin-repeat domain containing transcription coregulator asaA [Colletotrichum tropicale]
MILRHDGDPSSYNAKGGTAIHEAVKRHNLEGVCFLIRHDADPNSPSQAGLVPFHAACYEGDEKPFFAPLKEGATLKAAAYGEWSITEMALLASEKSILEMHMSNEYGQVPTPLMESLSPPPRLKPWDMVISAQRILAVVSSNQILPEKVLYEAYHHLIFGLNISRDQSWDAEAVNDLVDNMMDRLYSVSQVPRLSLGESFCSECFEFQTFLEKFARDTAAADYETYHKPVAFHKNKQELDDCAPSGCPVCLTISEKFQGLDDKGESGQNNKLLPVSQELEPQPEDLTEQEIDPHRIGLFTAQVGYSKYLRLSFDLRPYDTGFEIDQEYPLGMRNDTSTGSLKAMRPANHWIQMWKTSPEHSICRDTQGPSGSCSTLPTRVLNVGSEDREPFLFEGNELKEPYCILHPVMLLGVTGKRCDHQKQFITKHPKHRSGITSNAPPPGCAS